MVPKGNSFKNFGLLRVSSNTKSVEIYYTRPWNRIIWHSCMECQGREILLCLLTYSLGRYILEKYFKWYEKWRYIVSYFEIKWSQWIRTIGHNHQKNQNAGANRKMLKKYPKLWRISKVSKSKSIKSCYIYNVFSKCLLSNKSNTAGPKNQVFQIYCLMMDVVDKFEAWIFNRNRQIPRDKKM